MPEDLVTVLTLVWLVVWMYPSVFLQPRRIDKTLSAFLASMRLGPGVRADVTLQVRPLFENLGADRASNFVGHKTTPDGKQKTCYVCYQQGLLISYRVPFVLFSILKCSLLHWVSNYRLHTPQQSFLLSVRFLLRLPTLSNYKSSDFLPCTLLHGVPN